MVGPAIRGSYITVLWKCRSLVHSDGDMKEDEALATMPMANLPWAAPSVEASIDPVSLVQATVVQVGYGQPAQAGARCFLARRPVPRRMCGAPVMMELAATMPRHTPNRPGPAALPCRSVRTTRR